MRTKAKLFRNDVLLDENAEFVQFGDVGFVWHNGAFKYSVIDSGLAYYLRIEDGTSVCIESWFDHPHGNISAFKVR